jgi:hexosaminidase
LNFFRTFPRASAVAERLWRSDLDIDVEDATARLNQWRCKMIARGLQAQPIQSGYGQTTPDFIGVLRRVLAICKPGVAPLRLNVNLKGVNDC